MTASRKTPTAFLARAIEWDTEGQTVRLPKRVRIGFDELDLAGCDLGTQDGRMEATHRILGCISDRFGWTVVDCDLALAA